LSDRANTSFSVFFSDEYHFKIIPQTAVLGSCKIGKLVGLFVT